MSSVSLSLLFASDSGLFDKASHPEPMFGVDLNEVTEKFGVFADKTRGMIPLILRDIAKYLTDGENPLCSRNKTSEKA